MSNNGLTNEQHKRRDRKTYKERQTYSLSFRSYGYADDLRRNSSRSTFVKGKI